MNLYKLFARSYSYTKRFYGFVSVPLQFITYSTIIYDYWIDKTPLLKGYFPTLSQYLIYSTFFLVLFTIGGYILTKKTNLVIESIEISAEVNQYMNTKITKVQIPMYSGLIKLLEMHDIDVTGMKKILEDSL